MLVRFTPEIDVGGFNYESHIIAPTISRRGVCNDVERFIFSLGYWLNWLGWCSGLAYTRPIYRRHDLESVAHRGHRPTKRPPVAHGVVGLAQLGQLSEKLYGALLDATVLVLLLYGWQAARRFWQAMTAQSAKQIQREECESAWHWHALPASRRCRADVLLVKSACLDRHCGTHRWCITGLSRASSNQILGGCHGGLGDLICTFRGNGLVVK